MAKTIFICQECGASSHRWSGKCSGCDAWNSLVEETRSEVNGASAVAKPTHRLTDIARQDGGARLRTQIEELDQVLGGGIVPASVTLLAGEPGIGKSTLLLQLAANISAEKPVLYVSGEESLHQIKLRAERLKITADKLELLAETDVDAVASTLAGGKFAFAIIDSIQTMRTGELSAAAGTLSQITAGTHRLQTVAKSTDTAVLVVGHVTKEGNIAGPKILEHLVDVVLYLEGERFGSFKLLRGVKNRFGSTHEVGIFEMRETGLIPVGNPSARFLQERVSGDGSVVLAAVEGSRAILIEVQALVSTSPFGYPKRTAAGFELNRLNLLIAVLQQRAGINLSDKDVYINVVGGIKLAEPAADLAVALAIASAAKKRPLKDGLVAFGEIGLNGEVRSVNDSLKRIKEAKKLKFKGALAPKDKDDFVLPVASIREAISKSLRSGSS